MKDWLIGILGSKVKPGESDPCEDELAVAAKHNGAALRALHRLLLGDDESAQRAIQSFEHLVSKE